MSYQYWTRDIIHRPNGKVAYSKPYIVNVERGEEE
tara:strand:+ start:328 stop:432 length:105 start_codon:yes stop_codon:yes gene_type:complete